MDARRRLVAAVRKVHVGGVCVFLLTLVVAGVHRSPGGTLPFVLTLFAAKLDGHGERPAVARRPDRLRRAGGRGRRRRASPRASRRPRAAAMPGAADRAHIGGEPAVAQRRAAATRPEAVA
ncbi:hypothetical protein [Dactylosporangium salmoneum]